MNKERRKSLEDAIGLLQTAANIISEVKDEEEDSFENLPEGLQSSERGETMQEAISLLEDALQQVEEAVDNVVAARG